MRGLGQIGLPLQPWTNPGTDLSVTGYQVGSGSMSPSDLEQAMNLLPVGESAVSQNVINAPLENVSTDNTWLWFALAGVLILGAVAVGGLK